jgi:hypothetical protein
MLDWLIALLAAMILVMMTIIGVRELLPFILAVSR